MKLTRSVLAMILEEMDKNNVDHIDIDVGIYDNELTYIDFDLYHDRKFIDTVLTLK